MKTWTKIKKWIEENYDHISNMISGVSSILLSLLASFIYDKLKDEETVGTNFYIIFSLAFFFILLMLLLSILSRHIKRRIFKDADLNKYIQKAYIAIQDFSLDSQRCLQENGDGRLNEWFLQNIQLAINKCYDFFCSSFCSGEILIAETKFEVTYMTRSYKDGKITIPCSCNKEKRTPTSMLSRAHNPDIYKNTVTAEIYREYDDQCKPALKIIPDTTNVLPNQSKYHFVYENQNDRIKSSVVIPVFSHRNELLGTLVVHCNTANFFTETQRAFWNEILQLFASEIGKNKLLLDSTIERGKEPF